MKKTSTTRLNFFKVIFSDNSQSIFKLLCKQYPSPFFLLFSLKHYLLYLACFAGLDFSCGVPAWVGLVGVLVLWYCFHFA